jgi:hypothetical protein
MSCRTGPLSVGRPLRGVYTFLVAGYLLGSFRWSEDDDFGQQSGHGF